MFDKKDISILICSWNNPHLLRVFIPNILKSFSLDNELLLVLNQYDKESVDLCVQYGLEFVCLKENLGTMAVDYALPLIKGEYTVIGNDDMYFHKGSQ